MKIVLSGGGTAGHINPALAVAEVLQQQGHEVYFAGTPQGVEKRLVGQTNIPFTEFEAAGFDRSAPLTLFTSTFKILKSSRKAVKWMKELKPDVVVGFGGYVSIPVALAAEKLQVPVVVHEQNSVMGMANRFVGKRARFVALTYQVAGKDIADASKCIVTGNPVRSSMFKATRAEGREMLGVPENARMLLVFGGSLGARHINEALIERKQMLMDIDDLYIVHITGPKEYDTVVESLALTDAEKARWIVLSYQDKMAQTLAAADCVVARAGATSLAEISALGIPALLVPFPFATEDHQTMNARSYVEAGAAYLVADDALDSDDFTEKVMTLITDSAVRDGMKQAAAAFETGDAAYKLADVITRAAGNGISGLQ